MAPGPPPRRLYRAASARQRQQPAPRRPSPPRARLHREDVKGDGRRRGALARAIKRARRRRAERLGHQLAHGGLAVAGQSGWGVDAGQVAALQAGLKNTRATRLALLASANLPPAPGRPRRATSRRAPHPPARPTCSATMVAPMPSRLRLELARIVPAMLRSCTSCGAHQVGRGRGARAREARHPRSKNARRVRGVFRKGCASA